MATSLCDALETEYVRAASKWTKARKPTLKAYYLGVMEGIEKAMRRLVGDKQTESMINLTGYALKVKPVKKKKRP